MRIRNGNICVTGLHFGRKAHQFVVNVSAYECESYIYTVKSQLIRVMEVGHIWLAFPENERYLPSKNKKFPLFRSKVKGAIQSAAKGSLNSDDLASCPKESGLVLVRVSPTPLTRCYKLSEVKMCYGTLWLTHNQTITR